MVVLAQTWAPLLEYQAEYQAESIRSASRSAPVWMVQSRSWQAAEERDLERFPEVPRAKFRSRTVTHARSMEASMSASTSVEMAETSEDRLGLGARFGRPQLPSI